MKPTPTRTLNPLPFQDLEPHRFEDLVRQLAYEFRPWRSLEAIGRAGADEGLDIRGIEAVAGEPPFPEDESGDEPPPSTEERLWIFQCKREKAMSPKRLRATVNESLKRVTLAPHGFVLAVSSDVSKKARDAFREEMVARGVAEFAIWSRGELEDMLFQPRHDHLLFAYFGIALQARRRSMATDIRSEIARKKQITALLEGQLPHGRLVLLRDPEDLRYPTEPAEGEPAPSWLLCRAISPKKPGHLVVLRHEFLAATTPDGKAWDAITDYDLAEVEASNELDAESWAPSRRERDRLPHEFWLEHIPEQDRAVLRVTRSVPYTRILAIDPLGDGYYPVPHLIVPFYGSDGPFAPDEFAVLERAGVGAVRLELHPELESRKPIFPWPLPREGDPSPAGFDDTLDKPPLLSKSVRGRVRELVKSPEPAASRANVAAPEAVKETARRMSVFREWRDAVGRPTLSGFVRILRDAGQRARVVVRSVEPVPESVEPFESVELRVQLHASTQFNPSYWRSGHLRISASARGSWTLAVWPSKAEEQRRYSSPPAQPAPKLEGMSGTQLEALVLQMLERLKASY